MRRFLTISLLVMGGCGDNLGGGGETGDHDTNSAGIDNSGAVENKLIPQVCAAHSWPSVFAQDKDLALRAVPTQEGAAVFAVAKGGGPLYGFAVDARGLIIGDAAGTKIVEGNFTAMSATQIDGRLIVALRDDKDIRVEMLGDDLAASQHLTTLSGPLLGDTLMMYARGNYVAATGGVGGIAVNTFDAGFSDMGAKIIDASEPSWMSTTRYGNDAMVAWSTPDECHLARVTANTHSVQSFPCRNSRIATAPAYKGGQMVFEQDGGIHRTAIMVGAHNELANNTQLVPHGSSPRIVYDGKRYWVSFLSVHGDIVLGYLDENGTLVSMAIEGTRPMDAAYDLAVIDGSVWVYSFDGDNRYSANKMCLTREGLDPTIFSNL